MPTVAIPVVEEITYSLHVQISEQLWQRLQICRAPQEILAELIAEYDEEWFADQCAAANCRSCTGSAITTPHDMTGVADRYVKFPSWEPLDDLLTTGEGVPVPHEAEFITYYFEDDHD